MPKIYAKRLTLNAKRGFSLVEILIALFVIIALVTILFSSSGTLFATRTSKLQTVAAKIASKQIENFRNMPFTSLPAGVVPPVSPPPSPCPSPDADLDSLKGNSATNHGICSVYVTNYDNKQDPPASPPTDIKQITIGIDWKTDNNAAQNLKMDTLIYRNGL